MTILITKMNGEQEPFDESKLNNSLKRVGASGEERHRIISSVTEGLKPGMTTGEIYEKAFSLLRNDGPSPLAARYSIKRAILDLGPSGFPFEQFVAHILSSIGYTNVQTGVAAQGACVAHEVDVMGEHGTTHMGAEVKFHNSLGIKTDLKVALYVSARFNDLAKSIHHTDEGWLITNTRFTRNAIRFASCNGLKLLGWDYPHGRGLQTLIDEAGVHPITALTTLSKPHTRSLLEENIVLCRQILKDPHVLDRHGVPAPQREAVLTEARTLCKKPLTSSNSNA